MSIIVDGKHRHMSIYNELKRRNVIKVAIAYAVIAWVLMQVAATTFPALKLPDWTITLVAVLLLIGFPLALIFAWAFELTPEGIKLEKEVVRPDSITHTTGRKLDFIIIGVLAVALVLFAVDRFVLLPDTAPASDSAQKIAGTEVQQSIAVLPFVNMSDDSANEYFSDGLSEELLNLLAQIPGLKVIGRTSSFAFKGKNEDLRVIGQTLGVKNVLEGSVRKSGDQVRITAQLINVSDGAHIWSETYNRTMTDIFAVQDDVAAAIIDALQMHVGTAPTRGRPTESLDAYTLFLKARVATNRLEYRVAEARLKDVIQLDPNFAEAYELLAFTYWMMAGVDIKAAEAQALAGEATAKAIAIDPDLIYARALHKASIFGPKVRLRKLQAFEQAAREQPDNLMILDALITLLAEHGYLEEALHFAERLVDLDPLAPLANFHLAYMLYATGRTDEAIAALENIEHMNLDFSPWHWSLVGINLVEGRDEDAIAYIESRLLLNRYPNPGWFREMVTAARDPASGQAYLDDRVPQIIATMPDDDGIEWRYGLTVSYLYFGFFDRFFELTYTTGLSDTTWGGGLYTWIANIVRMHGITAHPKYLEITEVLGIIDTWEQRGPPDFCEKTDGQWVCE